MLISKVYTKYKILPFLQLHQLRVAAVAKQICDAATVPVNTQDVICTALLHDMGNILKFDLGAFPETYQPEGVEYWRGIQDEYHAKYGPDEHNATIAIARELGVSEVMQGYLSAVGFIRVPSTLADVSFEKKICCYADQRVAPYGVVSLERRLAEGGKRYAHHPKMEKVIGHRNRSADGLQEMERQIFASSTLSPAQITDDSVATLIEDLRTFDIKVD